jgi:hypothetical protein
MQIKANMLYDTDPYSFSQHRLVRVSGNKQLRLQSMIKFISNCSCTEFI